MFLDLRSLWEASASGSVNLAIDTPGSITFAGQATSFSIGVDLSTQGSLTIAGQAITASLGLAMGAGSVAYAGQSISYTIGLAQSTQGSIAFAGQSVSLASGTNLAIDTAGSITYAGQAITANVGTALSQQGAITFAGQSITLAAGGDVALSISPGAISFDGQVLTLTATGQAASSAQVGGGISGKARRKPHRPIRVLIDEEEFTVSTVSEAVELLDAAREIAEEKAQAVLAKALASNDRTKLVLRTVRHKLTPPVLSVNAAEGELTAQVDALVARSRASISKMYADTLRSAEIALLLRRAQEDDEDDDTVIGLLL